MTRYTSIAGMLADYDNPDREELHPTLLQMSVLGVCGISKSDALDIINETGDAYKARAAKRGGLRLP